MFLTYAFSEMMNRVTLAAINQPGHGFYAILSVSTNGRQHHFSKYGLDFHMKFRVLPHVVVLSLFKEFHVALT